ncbi:hypothetical protein L204_101237 [Cryptococcus depauperatus]
MAQFFNATGPITSTNHSRICNVLDPDAKAGLHCLTQPPPQLKHIEDVRKFTFELNGLIIAHVNGSFSRNFLTFQDINYFPFYSNNEKEPSTGKTGHIDPTWVMKVKVE